MFTKHVPRRRLLGFIGASALLPLLVACASSAAPTPSPAQPTAAPTKPAVSATAASPAPAPAQSIPVAGVTNVHFATWVGYLKDMIPLYEKTNPKINIIFDLIPFNTIADRLLVDLASGTSADLIQVPSTYWIPFMRRKITYPLDSLLKRDKVDLTGFNFPPDKYGQYDGQLWGLPRNIPAIRGFIYNKRLFAAAGVAYPPDYPDAWTWDDFTNAAQKLHKPPQSFAMTALQNTFIIDTMIRSNGGKIISDDDKTCLLDQPPAIEAVQQGVDWLLKDKVSMAPGEEKALGDTIFASDKIATNIEVLAQWDFYKTDTKNFTIPAWEAVWPVPPKTKQKVYAGEIHANAISGKSSVVDAAWSFLLWSTIDDTSLTWQMQYLLPNYHIEKYVDQISDVQHKKLATLGISVVKDTVLDYWGPNTTEVQKAFNAEHDLALLGKKSVLDAMKAATQQINQILASA